jgi:hypothetical protein
MRSLPLVLVLLVCAVGAHAYQVLLDIDIDDDPTTINELTWETEVLVDLIIAPTTPGEIVGRIEFGLGGSCRECDHVHEYGTEFDLTDYMVQPWVQASGWNSGWDGILYLGCPGSYGYHVLFWCEPLAGTLTLDAPLVLAEFTARINPTIPPGCSVPPANLGCLHGGEFYNYIQIGGPALGETVSRWGEIKSLYR